MKIIEKIKAIPDDRKILIYTDDLESGWPPDFTIADLKSLVTLIEQQSSVIEEAEKALERIADRNAHGVMVTIARDALSRIRQLKEPK